MSKDGDWILCEDAEPLGHVLSVLGAISGGLEAREAALDAER
jgi:hypothetical protein